MRKKIKYRERYRRCGKVKSKKSSKVEMIRKNKGCFGTKEYSTSAAICLQCKLHKDCGDVEPKIKRSIIVFEKRMAYRI